MADECIVRLPIIKHGHKTISLLTLTNLINYLFKKANIYIYM